MSPHADCHNSGGAKQMIQQKSTNIKKRWFDFFINVTTPQHLCILIGLKRHSSPVTVHSELAHLVHIQDQSLAISFNLMQSKMCGSVSHIG